MGLFQKIMLFSLIPVFTMVVGGILALVKKPGGNVRSLILHFAAGVIFSVVAVEIIPDVIRNHSPVMATIGFTLGFILMIGIRKLTAPANKKGAKVVTGNKVPWSLLAGIGVDIFIDGLLLGIGFAAGNSEGILLAIALSVELLSLGMATATELANNSASKKKSFGIIVSLAIVFFISALLGGTLLQNLSHEMMEVVLSFGLSALLFLVTEELLIEAHEEKETLWHTSSFFGGFLLFLIFGMLL
jgi:ZIP family zinc transporter